MKTKAKEVDEELLVPVRKVFGPAGASIHFAAGTLTVSLGERSVQLKLGEDEVSVSDGTETRTETWSPTPRAYGEVSYVPVRDLADALGFTVGYQDGTVKLSRPILTATPTPVLAPILEQPVFQPLPWNR